MDHARRSLMGLATQSPGERAGLIPIRPPWTIPESEFLEACTGCGHCVDVCPEKILNKGAGGFPSVDFKHAGCTFCRACVEICEQPVFISPESNQPWSFTASVKSSCLTFQGIECRSCQDVCEPGAIAFKPRVGGPAVPKINPSQCTGCGTCLSSCPNDSISFINQSPEGDP